MLTTILATLGVAYCSLWQWASLTDEGLLFMATDLVDLPADLREEAGLVLIVPMDLQTTPSCMAEKERPTYRGPIGIEEHEVKF